MEQKRNDQRKPSPSQQNQTNEPKRGEGGGIDTGRERDRPALPQRQQQAGEQSGIDGQRGYRGHGEQDHR